MLRATGVAAVALLCWSSIATAQTATEFTIPTPASKPLGIAAGPDGALWFTESTGNKIGRITTAGAVTEYLIPTTTTLVDRSSHPQCIVAGPDGAMWFVEGDGNKIGRITMAGVITEYPNFTGGWPQCLTVGPDGALWIADQGPKGGGATTGDGWIGRMTTAGVLTRFPLPRRNVQANFIAAGSDNALWFGTDGNTIGRITTAGVVTEFTLPTPNTVVFGITAGPDGALWFAEPVANKIGRITTAGVITEFALPTAGSGPLWIVTGPDGALWFTEAAPVPTANNNLVFTGNKIGRITTSGAITEFTLPTAGSGPAIITVGPDGALWFTEATANKIGRLTLPPTPPNPSQPVAPPPTTQAVFTASTGSMPTAAVSVSSSGTFGNATLIVTLDLSRVLLGGSFASLGQFAAGYNIYVVALVPSGALGLPRATWFMYPATRVWAALGSPIAAFKEGLAQNATNREIVPILQGMDVTSLPGTEFYIGYGTSDTEMLSAGRYRGVYKVQ